MAVSVFTIALVAAGLGSLNPWFLVGFAATVPIYLLTLRWYLQAAPPVYTAHRAAQSVRGESILGTLQQLPTVSAHRLEGSRLRVIRRTTWETVRWAMRTRIVQNRLFGKLNLAEAVGLFAVLSLGVWLVFSQRVSPGAATAAALLFLRTVAPIEALLLVMDDLQSALASLGRVIGVSGQAGGDAHAVGSIESSSWAPVDTDAPASENAAVVLEDLHFGYHSSVPVLRGIDLTLQHGETLAVVGASGSGKSTLAAVLAGVHQPCQGRIQLGVAAEKIVTVTQETHVFAGTVRENLTLAAGSSRLIGAAEDQTEDARLEAAMQEVGAAGLLDALPDGLDTAVGHGGHPLTAAQVQHLALARLILIDAELVVLDEATAEAGARDSAHLDAAAERVIEGRAALIVAHRLSQAAAADRIVVLDAGRISECGTHEELLAAGGTYARLWEAWISGSVEAPHR